MTRGYVERKPSNKLKTHLAELYYRTAPIPLSNSRVVVVDAYEAGFQAALTLAASVVTGLDWQTDTVLIAELNDKTVEEIDKDEQ